MLLKILVFATISNLSATKALGQVDCNIFSTRIKLNENHILSVEATKNEFAISTEYREVSLETKNDHFVVYIVQLTDSTRWFGRCTDVRDRPPAERLYPTKGKLNIRLVPYASYKTNPKTGLRDTAIHYLLEAKIKDALFENIRTSKQIEIPDITIFHIPEQVKNAERYERLEDYDIAFPDITAVNYKKVYRMFQNHFKSTGSIPSGRMYINVSVDRSGTTTPVLIYPEHYQNIKSKVEEFIRQHLVYPARASHEMPVIYQELLPFQID